MKVRESRATSLSTALLCTGLIALVLAYCSNALQSPHLSSWCSGSHVREVSYQVQVFSTDPIILYIRDFLSPDEVSHITKSVHDNFEVSRIWTDEVGYVDTSVRDSQSADLPSDHISRRIRRRARSFMGWRNNNTYIQPLRAQKYNFNGFYNFHYNWIEHDQRYPGNRMTTIMVYLEADCEGGGTNFPKVSPPRDSRCCDVTACEGDVEYDEYPGTTFKPVVGSAIDWESFHPNGTGHRDTQHARLPPLPRLIPYDQVIPTMKGIINQYHAVREGIIQDVNPQTASFGNVIQPLIDIDNATQGNIGIISMLRYAPPDQASRQASEEACTLINEDQAAFTARSDF
ncbi:Prolyl 4-hydroxylase, alpha subunit [Fusarium agapanthi]|uniref:Prolyl 4-hydroxylase, alpha subunit n=1 Tax=Fusarium agapanthi TaxID=1803897 RepID=A0A9P5BB82_9HYPO|nr:Prolyl 4-hydroxylase, alpha subunit [Fusarium agapanthi]